MRTALRDCLEAEGYRVLTAADGETGLAAALREKPDLILLDIMLPRLDGFALCAELRRLEVTTPVLMLTAKGQIEDRVTGLDVGADDYLVKPFSTEELLARVRALRARVIVQVHGSPDARRPVDLCNSALVRKRPLHLTAKELAMLRLMAGARASRFRASASSMLSGAIPRSQRPARLTITSPACAVKIDEPQRAALDSDRARSRLSAGAFSE